SKTGVETTCNTPDPAFDHGSAAEIQRETTSASGVPGGLSKRTERVGMSSRTTPRAVSLGAALPLMFVAAAPVRAGLVLSDDTFNSADWVATIVATADGGPHTVQQ